MDEHFNEENENLNETFREIDDDEEDFLSASGNSSENEDYASDDVDEFDHSLPLGTVIVFDRRSHTRIHNNHVEIIDENTDERFNEDDVNMDPSLAGMHTYLNKEMEPLVGRTIFDADSEVELFLFWRPHVILVPGQQFPISLPSAQADIFIKAKETDRIVGFIASSIDRVNLNGCVGTTAELISIQRDDTNVTTKVVGRQRFKTISVRRRSDNNLIGKVRILCEYSELPGSNKYPLQNSVPLSWRKYGSSSSKYQFENQTCHYEQLPFNLPSPEPTSSSPSNNSHHGFFFSRIFRRFTSRLSSSGSAGNKSRSNKTNNDDGSGPDHLSRYAQQTPLAQLSGDPMSLMSSDQSTWLTDAQLKESMQIVTQAMDNQGRPFRFTRSDDTIGRESRLPARRDVHAATAHALSRFPSWVYEIYDTERLIGKVTKELREWNSTWNLNHWTEEIAVQFSYWILQNLPVPDDHKIAILEQDHVVCRLRDCLDLLMKCSNFLCSNCQHYITSKQKIICLATEGSLQTFMNPHGHLHEMLTVSAVSNVHTVGRPTEEYSWFPGYAWTIMQCLSCSAHTGWRFSSCRSGLKPSVFYGVCRASVIPSFFGEDVDEDAETRRPGRFFGTTLLHAIFGNTGV